MEFTAPPLPDLEQVSQLTVFVTGSIINPFEESRLLNRDPLILNSFRGVECELDMAPFQVIPVFLLCFKVTEHEAMTNAINLFHT